MFRVHRARRAGAIAVALASLTLSGLAAAAPGGSHASTTCTAAGCTINGSGHGHDHAPSARNANRGRGHAGQACGQRIYVAGHHTWVTERVCIQPARTNRVWVDDVYQVRYDACGTPYRVLVRRGHWKHVQVPARYENRQVRRWVAGGWRTCDRTGYHVHRGEAGPRRGYERGRNGRRSAIRVDNRGIDIRLDRLFR